MDFEEQLATAMRASAETLSPPVDDLVNVGLQRGQRRRRRRLQVIASLTAVAVVVLGGGAALWNQNRGTGERTVAPAAAGCDSVLRNGVLPIWARAGFSEPEPKVPHVLSTHGRLAAILFGTLHAPPAAGVNNKILWVARDPAAADGALRIRAVRAGTTRVVRREVDGVGPSTVDLPSPGCWHLGLRWGTHHDSIDLDYQAP